MYIKVEFSRGVTRFWAVRSHTIKCDGVSCRGEKLSCRVITYLAAAGMLVSDGEISIEDSFHHLVETITCDRVIDTNNM